MIKNLNQSLDAGNYLVLFDLPAMNTNLLAKINDSVLLRNVFISDYKDATSFDLLDSGVKELSGTGGKNRLLVVIKVNSSLALRDVLSVLLSVVGVVTNVYQAIRFSYAEVTTVG